MLHHPYNEFAAFQKNYDQPQGATGVTVTPGISNTMGSWHDLLGGTLSDDAFGIYLHMTDGGVNGVSRTMLADIGVDRAGGTSYAVLIPTLLGCGHPSTGATNWIGSGVYFFPLFIPSGSRLGVRAQTPSNATTFRVKALLAQKPTRPELLRCGTVVEAIGANSAASRGTLFTPGASGAAGAWASLGTNTNDGFFTQFGFAVDDASGTNAFVSLDFALGDMTTKRIIAPQLHCGHTSGEQASRHPWPEPAFYREVPAATEFFVRGSHSGTPDDNHNATAYIVRGG